MRLKLSHVARVAILVAVGCTEAGVPGGGGPGASETGGVGGTSTGGRRGTAMGGASGTTTGGAGGMTSGGAGGTGGPVGGSSGAGGDPATGADARATEDVGTVADGPRPTTGDAGMVNLAGSIPPYEGPPVGPEVKMDCPGDPTAGFAEYKDTFKVEHPFDRPVTDRFSLDGGVYTFWVMKGDKRANPNSAASNPRTEARYSQNFRTGIRLFSADVFWEKSVSHGTVVMQVHTTTTGIGPVYLVANGDNVPPISGSKVPGGLFDRWINLKVLINAQTTASQFWVNNCPVGSNGSGTRGDGNDYFKIGVYHCDSGTCRARVKNIHLYIKQ